MKLIITNTDTYFLPLLSNCEEGWADTLAYNTPYELDRPETDVATSLGDKPGWLESFKETLLGRLMATFIDRWHHRDEVTTPSLKNVHALITNEGELPCSLATRRPRCRRRAAAWTHVALRGAGVHRTARAHGRRPRRADAACARALHGGAMMGHALADCGVFVVGLVLAALGVDFGAVQPDRALPGVLDCLGACSLVLALNGCAWIAGTSVMSTSTSARRALRSAGGFLVVLESRSCNQSAAGQRARLLTPLAIASRLFIDVETASEVDLFPRADRMCTFRIRPRA